MYNASEQLNEAICGNRRKLLAKIKAGEKEITEGFKSIRSTMRSCSSDSITIGGAVSAYTEIEMWKPNFELENTEVEVSIGLQLESVVEWVPLGLYTIQKPQNDDGFIKFTAYDRIQSKMSGAYFSRLSYPADGKAVLREISSMTGVPIDVSNLADGILIQKRVVISEAGFDNSGNAVTNTTFEEPFNGYSYREALGYVAMLYCKFAIADRTGTVVFRWYEQTDYVIGPDRYYDDLVTSELVFFAQAISCRAWNATFTAGTGEKTIELENPVMTQEQLNTIYAQIKNLQFLPAGLSFYGDVCVDVGDLITVNDKYGNIVKIPIMSIVQEFDGGLSTKIQSYGGTQAGNTAKGPTLQRLDRTYMELFLVKELIGSKASFDYVYSIDGEFKNLKSDYGSYKTLVSNEFATVNGQITNLSGDFASFKTGEFATLQAKQANFETVTSQSVTAVNGRIDTLAGDFADYKKIIAQDFTATNGEIDTLTGEYASFKEQTVEKLTADRADIEHLKTTTLELDNLIAQKAEITELNATNAQISNLSGQFSSFETSMSQEMITAKGWMLEGAIGDAQISKVSANKLGAGTIDTAIVTVAGTDGRLQIQDNTIQIKDANRVRVQVGKDASGDYSMSVWDASGQLIWDVLGATENTIQRKIIRDRMVADDAAIQALKLDLQSFNTALTSQGVTISGTVVQVGNKTLNVALSEQTQTISDNYTSLKNYTDTAKSAAISAAATDATAKANSALNSAKSYVDDIEIGGRNLLTASSLRFISVPQNANWSTYVVNSLVSKKFTNDGFHYVPDTSVSTPNNSGGVRFKIAALGLTIGDSISISADIRGKFGITNTGFMVMSANTSSTNFFANQKRITEPHPVEIADWTRVSGTYTIPSNFAGEYLYVFFGGGYGGDNLSIYVRNVKIEKGTKATDWTPAPEDTEAELHEHAEQISSHETRIAANESAISLTVSSQEFNSYKSTVNGELASAKSRLSTAESSITAMQGQIALKVEQTDIDSAVQNLQIGGRNLLLDTKKGYHLLGSDNGSVSVREKGKITINESAYGNAYTWVENKYSIMPQNLFVRVGEYFTFSIDLRITGSFTVVTVALDCRNGSHEKNIVMSAGNVFDTANDGKWIRVSGTAKVTDSDAGYVRSLICIEFRGGSVGSTIEYRNPKLEKGIKATDWSPAPEDIDAYITAVDNKFANYSTTVQMQSAINIAKDSITDAVSETYATKSALNASNGSITSLTSRMESAESKLTKASLTTTIGSYYATQEYVDDIEIGGRNLARGTSSEWSDWITPGNNANNSCITAGYAYLADNKLAGDEYTCSIEIEFSGVGKGTGGNFDFNTQGSVDGVWVMGNIWNIRLVQLFSPPADGVYRYTATVRLNANAVNARKFGLGFRTDYWDGNGKYRWRKIKVEKGTKATDWSPAPEDTLSYIADVETIAKQTQKEFSWVIKSDGNETNFTLTDQMARLVSDELVITDSTGASTIISGGKMDINAIFAQDINGAHGKIGCWNMDANRMYDNSGQNAYVGVNKYGFGMAFWAGGSDLSGNTAPFKVDHSGILTATQATITGDIHSTSMIADYAIKMKAYDGGVGRLFSTGESVDDTRAIFFNMDGAFNALHINAAAVDIGQELSVETIYAGSIDLGDIRMWSDSEGGQIDIVSPGGYTWGMDAYDDSFRLYGLRSDGYYICPLRLYKDSSQVGINGNHNNVLLINGNANNESSIRYQYGGTDKWAAGIGVGGTGYDQFGWYNYALSGNAAFIRGSDNAFIIYNLIHQDWSGTQRKPLSSANTVGTRTSYVASNSSNQLKVGGEYGSSGSFSTRTISTSSSDVRLKTNINDSRVEALPIINRMPIREFDWIQTGEHQKIGVVVDEIEQLDPLLAMGGGYNDDGTMDIKCVNMFYLDIYMLKAIQELSQKLEEKDHNIQSLQYQLDDINMKNGDISRIESRQESVQTQISELRNTIVNLRAEMAELRQMIHAA